MSEEGSRLRPLFAKGLAVGRSAKRHLPMPQHAEAALPARDPPDPRLAKALCLLCICIADALRRIGNGGPRAGKGVEVALAATGMPDLLIAHDGGGLPGASWQKGSRLPQRCWSKAQAADWSLRRNTWPL